MHQVNPKDGATIVIGPLTGDFFVGENEVDGHSATVPRVRENALTK